jgi:hypothetical protein
MLELPARHHRRDRPSPLVLHTRIGAAVTRYAILSAASRRECAYYIVGFAYSDGLL